MIRLRSRSPSMPTPRPIKVIGITGGVGAGKSALAARFADLGCVVSDSDAHARAVLAQPDVCQTLARWWGPSVLTPDGRADRTRIASIVFSDPEARRRLEDLVHPLIAKVRAAERDRAVAAGAPAMVIDAPLLIEAGLDRECDAVVFADAPREVRAARVHAARGWDEAELHRREAAQLPLDQKRRRCHFVLNTDRPPADIALDARAVLDAVLAGRIGPPGSSGLPAR